MWLFGVPVDLGSSFLTPLRPWNPIQSPWDGRVYAVAWTFRHSVSYRYRVKIVNGLLYVCVLSPAVTLSTMGPKPAMPAAGTECSVSFNLTLHSPCLWYGLKWDWELLSEQNHNPATPTSLKCSVMSLTQRDLTFVHIRVYLYYVALCW